MKTDAEILGCKDEADLTPEELTRKKELVKEDEEAKVQLAKKKLAERAKAIGLSEDAKEEDIKAAELKLAEAADALKVRAKAVGLPETATEAEVLAKEKEIADSGKKTLADNINNENEQTTKLAVALGLSATSSLQEIYAAASKAVEVLKNKIVANPTLAERAKKIGLSETATEKEVVAKEKQLSDAAIAAEIEGLMRSDIQTLEVKLSEMKTKGADALTVKLLEENIAGKKKLHEEQVKNKKDGIELKLKEHFRAGKLTSKEKDVLKVILCSEVESGETSFKLSEQDKDGKEVEVTRTLGEIMDVILNDRPAIIELQEIAKKELTELPKEKGKELAEGESEAVGARVAQRVTGSSKTAKQLAERAKKAGLPSTATLAEIELKEQGK